MGAPAAQLATARLESILVVGNDAVLAARPATAVQLAHAAMRAGFDAVVPASWGDELVATECTRRLAAQPTTSAIFCACPEVALRTLSVGVDLAPFMVSLVPPPVAVAQYLRALYGARGVRLTYVGRCPGAQDDAYDARITPDELLRLMTDRGIPPASQPDAFDAIMPPDRRRYASLAGGLPVVTSLRAAASPHSIVEISNGDFAAELAQLLLDAHPTLIDAAIQLGCACAGARAGCSRDPRIELMAVEPPRSSTPVVDIPEWMRLELGVELPVAPRNASDLVAAINRAQRDRAASDQSPAPGTASGTATESIDERQVDRPVDPVAADDAHPPRRRSPAYGTPVLRPPAGAGPIARDSDGRVLPRAYVARRRSGPRPEIDDAARVVPPPSVTDPG